MNLIVTLLLMSLFTACSMKKVETISNVKYFNTNEVKEPALEVELEVEIVNLDRAIMQVVDPRIQTQLNFFKDDKYASLCADKLFFEKILDVTNPVTRESMLEDMLLRYVENLANGCIDIEDMNTKIAKNKINKIKNSFATYTKKIDTKKILKQYKSKKVTLDTILQPYIPRHPEYLKFISFLEDKNISKEQRYKLRLNIERLKLMKPHKGSNFIQLNIPAYSFDFYEKSKKSMSFGIVVGDLEDQTPILSSKLNYFIVNPAWNIPDTIAKKTIIPKMLKDKEYLSKKGIQIHKNYKLSSKQFEQEDIKWDKYLQERVKHIPYKFIQLPSKTNGMGRVKFIFPNEYAIYMHDTIGSWRFQSSKQSIRAVSHGCVRLEHPLALIKYISTHYTKKSYKSVRADYDSNQMKTISLSKSLPVHISYITAYIDADNRLRFYKDLYGYDSMQKLNFSL